MDTDKDKKQSEQFIETARELGADESRKKFERALKKIVPRRKKATKRTGQHGEEEGKPGR